MKYTYKFELSKESDGNWKTEDNLCIIQFEDDTLVYIKSRRFEIRAVNDKEYIVWELKSRTSPIRKYDVTVSKCSRDVYTCDGCAFMVMGGIAIELRNFSAESYVDLDKTTDLVKAGIVTLKGGKIIVDVSGEDSCLLEIAVALYILANVINTC